jgi:hypothetical protein
MKCEHCVDFGGMIHCERLDRAIPTAGTGEPVRPEDCPIKDETTPCCESIQPLLMTDFGTLNTQK